jgi:hypothetical protein
LFNLSSLTSLLTAYPATDGTLAVGAKELIGDWYRLKVNSTGTYGGTNLLCDLSPGGFTA